jgi:molybdate transport system substrate-binding protein
MYRWFIAGCLIVALALAACGPQATGPEAQPNEVVVFAAASLTESFTQIGQDFEAANPGTTVVLNFANSQQLAQQLAQGAPADVFASANPRQMDVAIEAGRVAEDTPQVFVNNRLVVVVPADNPGGVETLADLAQPGLKLVLAAEDTPIGTYSRDYLDKAAASGDFASDYREALLANVVSYEQTVKAVLTKVVLGEADAGIVYSSDVTPDVADEVQRIAIPDDLNTIATYPIAPVSDSTQPAVADAFIGYVLSSEGQDTLAGFGFIPLEE